MSRFNRRGSGFHMATDDALRCRQVIQELVDVLDDALGQNVYSHSIANEINEGISSFTGNPSAAALERVLALVRAAITRVERNPSLVKTGQDSQLAIASSVAWSLLHPAVVELGRPRFDAGHFADAVEATFKEVNSRVKLIFKTDRHRELDGVDLMRQAFRLESPVIVLDDLQTESGKNIQRGYLDLFAGAMSAIRNPKAHDNVVITPERAIHHLFLASLLLYKLEERLEV